MSQDEVSQANALAPSRSSLSNSLTTLLKLGGAVTATGFLVGWLYQQGLMDGMELPSNIFPAKIEDLLFMTYLVALAASTVALSSFAEYLIWGAIAAIIAGLVVGALLGAFLVLEEKLGLKGWATRLLEKIAERRIALGMVVGTTSVVASTATVVGLCSAAVLLVLVPLPAYVAGKEEGIKVRSLTDCDDRTDVLLAKCAEATFENGEKVVGIYLAGAPGLLALRVKGHSVVFTSPVRALRFGSQPRPGPTPK